MKTTSPPAALPRWKCLNQRDADKLIAWTNARLDEKHALLDEEHELSEMLIQLREFSNARGFIPIEGYDYGPYGPTLPPSLEMASEAAKSGNITLLRRIYPELVEYLQPPSHKRGRPPTSKDGDRVWEAVRDVKLIQQIWKEHYDQFYRPKNDKVTAVEIASERNRLTSRMEKTLGNRRKKLKKPF
jgi:hypothetical protein